MEIVDVRFIKTNENAILPIKNHNEIETGDAGYDIFAIEDVEVPAGGSAIIPVGFKVGYITPGYWFRIEARSGLGFKYGLMPHFGIIDNGYRGDLGIKVYNLSRQDYTVTKGQACAQFIVYKMISTRVNWTDEATESKRGEKGFGSSDNRVEKRQTPIQARPYDLNQVNRY